MLRYKQTLAPFFRASMEPDKNKRKKAIEEFYLTSFLQTETGRIWHENKELIENPKQESPDFLFKTKDNTNIGLELVDWVNDSKHFIVTKTLLEICRDICQTVLEQKGINLSLIIDIYDPKRWEIKTRKDFLESIYNPGVSRLKANSKKIKQKFIEEILNRNITEIPIKETVEVNSQYFTLTFNKSWYNFPEFHVNNLNMYWREPLQHIQKLIEDKNGKYKSYIKNCTDCDLLIVSPLYHTGNCLIIPDELEGQKFKSSFRNIYFMEFHGFEGAKSIKLETTNKKQNCFIAFLQKLQYKLNRFFLFHSHHS